MLPHTKLLSKPRSSNFYCCHFCCAPFRIYCLPMCKLITFRLFFMFSFLFCYVGSARNEQIQSRLSTFFQMLEPEPNSILVWFLFCFDLLNMLIFSLHIYRVYKLKKKGALQILKISLISFASFRSVEFTLANST